MTSPDKIWVIEYNPKTKQTHIQTLKQTIESNIRCIMGFDGQHFPEYLIIGTADSPEEAHGLSDEMVKALEENIK